MFNKLYQWFGTGIANLRNGEAPGGDHIGTGQQQDGPPRRKRPIDCLEDVDGIEEHRAVKKFRIGDFMDTMKNAAEGVKTHGSSVASWMRSSVSPTLRNMLPASPDPPQTESTDLPTSLPAANASGSENTESKVFHFLWRTVCSVRTEQSVTISKVSRRQFSTSFTQHDTHKTNGHSANLPSLCTSKPCPSPRLGRPLYLRPHRTPSRFSTSGPSTGNTSYTSMFEKTFPIRVVQSPSHGTSSRQWRGRPHCTAQESVREEEKEVYRQLLSVVSDGQSSFFCDGSHPGIRSHRDFSSFLTTSRRLLRCVSPAGSGAGESSFGLSSQPPSPHTSSALPSPVAVSNGPEPLPWSSENDHESGLKRPAVAMRSALSPAALQDTSSQDTQSSAHDGDSVIFVKEQQGKRSESSRFHFPAGFSTLPYNRDFIPLQPYVIVLLACLQVINFYMNMLVERSKASHLPSVYTFNTFFYPKLRSSGYSTVRRWTKKVDIFSVDIILVPVHLGVHWCLSVVDFRKKSIMYFDSMGGNNDEACRILFKITIRYMIKEPLNPVYHICPFKKKTLL
uniref:Si:dkey-21c19.3 n=1 Tax=Astyanax mexicanus TaxID=7994 RepID=A0A8B9HYX6_ASTMX